MISSKRLAIFCFLLALAAAEQQREASAGSGGDDVVTSSRLLHPVTLVQALDVLRGGRHRTNQKKSQKHLDAPLGNLRRVREDDGRPPTSSSTCASCEAALAEAEENLATCEETAEEPSYLFVQMADQCIFHITDSGNLVLKSRKIHDTTTVFSDRPFTYEVDVPTESFFDGFEDEFNADNGGKPNAAITLVKNDVSMDVVVSVFVKVVVKHRNDPDGPTYVYKLEQSDEQASATSLSDIMGGEDKMTYDHCSIFIDGAELLRQKKGAEAVGFIRSMASGECSVCRWRRTRQ